MTVNEVLIHVDFAENYIAKLSSAVQSAHFGASQHQITLHTGVYYIGPNGSAQTFCSVSDSLQHGPAAIWTHMLPVIDDILETNKDINSIHFFSDGPSAQYRQKLNFFIFANVLAQKGIKSATWNFFESGHGKGVPDGVGAAVKRAADRRVLGGEDIWNAQILYEQLLPKSTVRLYHIEASMVEENVKQLSGAKVSQVPGTMRLHQIIAEGAQAISYRVVSCFCQHPSSCSCFNPTKFTFSTLASIIPDRWLIHPNNAAALNRYTDFLKYLFLV